jgi:enediyne biosynthesis protein E4
MNMAAPPTFLKNTLPPNTNWIKLQLQGAKSNRSALGATVQIQTQQGRQTAAVQSSSSFLSSNDPRLHFGLGQSAAVQKLTVRWPYGASEEFTGLQPNRLNLLIEGTGKAQIRELPQ